MNDRHDVDHEDLLERAIESVMNDPIPDEPPVDRVVELVAKVQQAADQTSPVTFVERIKNMKTTTRIVLAASVLIALGGLLSWLVPGSGTVLAFDDVTEALNNVQSATWKTTTVVKLKGAQDEPVTSSAIGMFLAPSHERTETTAQGGKSILIVDGQKDKIITLVPSVKTAMVMNVKNLPSENPFGKTFQGLQQLVATAQSGTAGKVERLDAKTIDGRPTHGFRIQLGAVEVKIWADPKTLLPVRVEQATGTDAGPEVRIVMTDFQVGVDLDESLFSLDVPAGYTVQQTMQIDVSKDPWSYLAEVLKMVAEYNDGVFPPELRGEQGIDGMMQRAAGALAKKHAKDSPKELMKLSADIGMKLGGAFGVLNTLPADAWQYAGKDVKLNTPNRPILWVKKKKGDRAMVIYADLTIQEVAADELPEDPKP